MDVYLGIRVSAETKQLLEQWSTEDDRSVSSFLRKLIEAERIRRTKFLKKELTPEMVL